MSRFFAIAAAALVGTMGLNSFAAAQYPPRLSLPQVGCAGVAAVQVQIQQQQIARPAIAVPSLTPAFQAVPAAPAVKAVPAPVRAYAAPEKVHYSR